MGKVWLSVSSTLLAFAFVFGNSIRTIYESIIFLFVIHPFDVGDAIVVHDDYYRVRLCLFHREPLQFCRFQLPLC